MGRKRLKYKKKSISVSINEKTLEELERVGITNKSRLFQISADIYLRKKKRLNNKGNNGKI